MKQKTLISLLLTICVLTLLVNVAGAQEGEITITDLGTLGGNNITAYGINNLGQVVGESWVADNSSVHAFMWSAESGMTDLGTLGGLGSSARGINDLGQVVGESWGADYTPYVFLWSAESGMTDLGIEGHAFGINDLGQVVVNGSTGGYLWSAESGMTDLGTLGGTFSIPFGINNYGQVVGYSETVNSSFHAFLWSAESGMIDLGTLGGMYSIARGINDFGQVVGESQTADGSFHAFLWSAESGMTDLGTLGGLGSSAQGINDLGQVVGGTEITDFPYSYHAFLWTAESGMTDLGTLGGNYSDALGINNFGQIAGNSDTADGSEHATLWTITLPSTKEVTIDIKPGSQPNAINRKSSGKIPLAILSRPDFDAPTEIDKSSLTFGSTGDEVSLAFCNKSAEDVNSDGLLDQVCHFYTKKTGFQENDLEGILKGQTVDGTSIEGHDSVRIVR